MANPEHLEILKRGVEEWNQWREAHPDITPDFSRANLAGADLSRADFSWTGLSWADLSEANLNVANFEGAELFEANLESTNLIVATSKG